MVLRTAQGQHDQLRGPRQAASGERRKPKPSDSTSTTLRAIFLVGSLSLILTDGTAAAQSGPPPKSATSSTTAQIPRTPNDPTKADRLSPSDQERIAQYTAQCLNDWDAATHMTKQEWARVCRRVADNRVKFMLETGFGYPIPVNKRQGVHFSSTALLLLITGPGVGVPGQGFSRFVGSEIKLTRRREFSCRRYR